LFLFKNGKQFYFFQGPQTPQEIGAEENGQDGMEEPPDTEEEAMDID
jgi:hypothetical protein